MPLTHSTFWRVALTLLFFTVPARSWDLFISGSEGYTHYEAKDFNRVLTLMEKTTKEKGFNPYTVSKFDGHPQNALTLGVKQGPWALGLEAEFWVEKFTQSEVAFDLENAERDTAVTCSELRNPAYKQSSLFGCIEASEKFDFLPITLQLSYAKDLSRWFRVGAGYGIGVLAGAAQIEMTAKYYGDNAIDNDHIDFQIWPGVNMVQKAFADAEYLPWKWIGLDWRMGWRFSKIEGLTLRNQQGDSRIFKSVFPDAKDGAHMYFASYTNNPDDDKIYVGTEADAKAKAEREPGSRFHLVNGDFTGWFVALKLNLYWRDI
ncbi:MAG: hypothetical protein JWO30_2695 [Fibrobacteres bacterium]|nr:hypothetical protein [Fibrobacterota bacterium]